MILKENMEFLTSIVQMLGTIIGVIGVIATIWFGLNQINGTLTEQRFSNRLELADDLVSEYMSLSSYASKAAYYLVADANGDANELIKIDSNYPNYAKMHSEALEDMKGKIAAYGSAELVNLFFDSYNAVQKSLENKKGDLDAYKYYFYTMPLITSCIRYDLTGEKINPSVFYNSAMQELKAMEVCSGMENFYEKMISTNDRLVKKYDLPKEFIWEETISRN